MKAYIIYLATSPSNKVYVGTTSKSLIERSKEHIWLAKGKEASEETKEKLSIVHLSNTSRLGHKIQFCPKGHDTFICGREKSGGGCKQCRRKAPMM
jgi:hypothetical protein